MEKMVKLKIAKEKLGKELKMEKSKQNEADKIIKFYNRPFSDVKIVVKKASKYKIKVSELKDDSEISFSVTQEELERFLQVLNANNLFSHNNTSDTLSLSFTIEATIDRD